MRYLIVLLSLLTVIGLSGCKDNIQVKCPNCTIKSTNDEKVVECTECTIEGELSEDWELIKLKPLRP